MSPHREGADASVPGLGRPRVSIVLAVHDGADYLATAVRSVLDQTFRDLELLIVNDGSTDRTAELADAMAVGDSRVRVFHRTASGRPSIPRNFGMDQVAGDYVAFLDHDDWYDTERLGRMVGALDEHPHWVAAFHDIRLVEADGREHLGTFFHNHHFLNEAAEFFRYVGSGWFETDRHYYHFMSLRNTGIQIQSVIVARHRIDFASFRFDSGFVMFEDNDLWFRLALLGPIGYLDRVLAYYRQRPNSLTRDVGGMRLAHLRMHQKNLERARGVLDAVSYRRYVARVAELHFEIGFDKLNAGASAEAREEFRAALRLHPSMRHRLAMLKTWLPRRIWSARPPRESGSR